jgi:SAM-dependent methyltransferase
MSEADREADASRLSSVAYTQGDATGWFEPLYAEAAQGRAVVPWDRGTPDPRVAEWLATRDGTGRSAVVVGCGLGRDAELVASLGYCTTAFDLSPTAVRGAQERHPGSAVSYEVADLFDLPERYGAAFDLTVESYTVQSLPDPPRAAAIAAVGSLVAPGGTLLVIAFAGAEPAAEGPPFPLTRAEIDSFAGGDLRPVRVEHLVDDTGARWRAEFRRSAPG